MNPATERLFLALWPNAAAVKALQMLRATLIGVEGRLTPESNLHVTLVFLGATGSAQRQCIEGACSQTHAEPIEIKLDRIRYRARSGVIGIESVETPPALIAFVQALGENAAECGLVRSLRPYRPHMTLARDVRGLSVPLLPTPVVWTAETFCLVKSTLGPGGSRYTIEREWALGQR